LRPGGRRSTAAQTSGFLLNPSPIERLPWDIRNAARELRHGKIALLEDHHIDSYLALFRAN